ncbi:MAG: YgjV family protein [Clostridiales bacterium]|nr:YgjV family protein [Clostridiales bacterium]
MFNLLTLTDISQSIVSTLSSSLGIWYAILYNFIGVIAIGVKITETQMKKRSKIVFFACICSALWITYFILNGNFTNALVNSVGMCQLLVFSQRGKRKWADSYFWLGFFITVQLVASIFTWSSWLSIFSITAGFISTVAYFVMDEKLYRYLFAILISLWVINGIVYFYWIALIHDVFALISIIIAIIRYNILGKKKKEAIDKGN